MNYNDKKVLFLEKLEKFEAEKREPENCHHCKFLLITSDVF